ncbi:MAG: cytidylate kinase-like family protein [Gemmatimonadota bacterium]
MLITMSRQFGAGSATVSRMVAQALGWTVVDNEFVDEVARKAGIPAEQVAKREERAPTFGERLKRALVADPEVPLIPSAPSESLDGAKQVKATEAVVGEIAAAGRVILVGRAAVAVLARDSKALHVRLVAPRPFRLKIIMERLGVDEKQALKALIDTDAHRARYHRDYYQRDWSDPVNYHMVLNTDALGFTGAADLIVARARGLGW